MSVTWKRLNYSVWVTILCFLAAMPVSNCAALQQQGSTVSGSGVTTQDQSAAEEYASILRDPDLRRKSIQLESFLTQHADSALVAEAERQTLAAYASLTREQFIDIQTDRHPEKATGLPALLVAVFLDRKIVSEMDPSDPRMKAGCQRAHEGIRLLSAWPSPQNLPEDQYQRLRQEAEGIFHGMAGFCAFRKGNYVDARTFFLRSLRFDADNIGNLSQLAIADLEMNPIDVNGFWYAAREETLLLRQYGVNVAADAYPYGKDKYVLYHGSLEGWDEIVAQAATRPTPSPGFTVTPRRKSAGSVPNK